MTSNKSIRSLRSRFEQLESKRLLAADLSITLEEAPNELRTTEELSYVVRIHNNGPDDALGALVEISDIGLESFRWTRQGPHSFPPEVAPQELNGTNGTFLEGIRPTAVGDVNDDGLEDFFVSADDMRYVVFGTPDFVDAAFHAPASLDGTNGFVHSDSELYLKPAGDVNGDGVADLLAGPYIVFGGENVGRNGQVRASQSWRITSSSVCDDCRGARIGQAAGDVNGDGFDDLLISDSDIGSVWVIYGSSDTNRSPVHLSTLDGTNGFRLHVNTLEEWEFGNELAGVGDVNADGFDDFIVNDDGRLVDGEYENTVYLVYGGPNVGDQGELTIDPTDGADGVTRFVHRFSIGPVSINTIRGIRDTTLADANNDGYVDLLLDNILMPGGPDGFAFERATPDSHGVIDIATVEGAEQFLPQFWRATFGDLNHDGATDYFVRDVYDTLFDDGIQENGATYAFFGNGNASPLNVKDLDGENGFLVRGPAAWDRLGGSVAVVDANSDKIDDLLMGTANGTYVVFGSDSFESHRNGAVAERVNIPAGGDVIYTLSGVVPFQATATIFGAASVSADNDLNPEDNSINGPRVNLVPTITPAEGDLSVTISNQRNVIFPSDESTYVVTVSNPDVHYVVDARLAVELDSSISAASWRRTDDDTVGVGNIEETINVPPGEHITYEITYTAGRKTGEVTSTATVALSPQQTDSNPANNLASDIDQAPLRPQFPSYVSGVRPCFEDAAEVNGELFFVGYGADQCYTTRSMASSGFYGGNLRKTDGTDAGTSLILQLEPASLGRAGPLDAFSDPDLTEFGGVAYFSVDDVSTGQELWRSDGTAAGTYVVKDIASERRIVSTGYIGDVEINPSAEVDNLGATSNYLLFSANDEIHGRELWRTDGTEAGTTLVKDINPGSESSFERDALSDEPEQSIVYNDIYFFIANDGVHGLELWRSDGTTDGTYLLKDISQGAINSSFARRNDNWWIQDSLADPNFQIRDGLLYFNVNVTKDSQALWRTDGSEAGTFAADINSLPVQPDGVKVGDQIVTFDNGNFYRSDQDGESRQLVAAWTDEQEYTPTWMKGLGDQIVFAFDNHNAIEQGSIYKFDTKINNVEIAIPHKIELPLSQSTQLTAATELLSYSVVGNTTGYTSNSNDYWFSTTSPAEVLGETTNDIAVGANESVTLGFPNAIVDGPGDDIRILTPWRQEMYVEGIDANGQQYDLGIVGLRESEGLDLSALDDLPPLSALQLTPVERRRPAYLQSVFARTEAHTVLTASGTNSPDLKFSWDLNNDGVFGDRTGRSVGLTRDDLETYGLNESGEYTVRVRMNDRVNNYFDSATIEIVAEPLLGDIDGNGEVGFADFLILSSNFGKDNAIAVDGDLDGDGKVSPADFLILSQNFGRTEDT